ncbi:hypothetical protein CRM22_001563 [Opisthorchis felineus]|uniref:Glutamate--cysteine ligase n=1 Tax=Opisthorchis felineus TaxID=147828 RepID=A0A4S2MA31_OPIFE|nr:hypothetical protein CRM22_001563 [Opisthorchis felineus]
MGLLTSGTPLHWNETKKHARYIQAEGIRQFIYLYQTLNSRTKHTLKWGDEIEYTLLRADPKTGVVQLYLTASDLLQRLPSPELDGSRFIWSPEYAEYQIEGLPAIPFGQLLYAFSTVQPNMRKRRQQLMEFLPENTFALTLTVFPRLGCPEFSYPPANPTPADGASKSLFFPDQAITQLHPRFRTLTRTIRERRGTKVAINVPIFRDSCTPDPFVEDFSNLHDGSDPDAASAALPNHVYMDAMGFGMGCSCLQLTFQSCCIEEARILYDQLATICPILMALSAASPAIRGYLLDTDCRWGIISASVDDRTEEERGLKPLEKNRFVIPKSRYDSISSYLSLMGQAYNDIPLVYDQEFYETLMAEGVDDALAKHVAHLFIREPVSLFEEQLVEKENSVEHFENIQSTNWQSMRFKPPPPDTSIGWRVEFRPMELQLTDFENAAFVSFLLLLSRTILRLKLNLLIPISKVDENMKTAVKRDAVRNGLFYFRHGHMITTDGSPIEWAMTCARFRRGRSYSVGQPDDSPESGVDDSDGRCVSNTRKKACQEINTNTVNFDPEQTYTAMTVDQIMNGCDTFPGLIPLVRHYVHVIGGEPSVVCLVHQYLNLLQRRASGELMTTAAWMRSRIRAHPDYKFDSYVSQSINTDLMLECLAITRGEHRPSEFLPPEIDHDPDPNRPCRLDPNCLQCVGTSSCAGSHVATLPTSQ